MISPEFIPIKTRILSPPKDDLLSIFEDPSFPSLKNEDILYITSKVLSIHQGRCISISKIPNIEKFIREQSDIYIDKTYYKKKYPVYSTLKNQVFIPSAGIDESNGNGTYILWPENIDHLLKSFHQHLTKQYNIKKLGIVALDSQPIILKNGISSVCIGLYGVNPVISYEGRSDLFSRDLNVTQVNPVESLAGTCGLLMGEGDESRPMVIARNIPLSLEFGEFTYKDSLIDPKDDMFYPILKDLFK